jgi:hypothetical protein
MSVEVSTEASIEQMLVPPWLWDSMEMLVELSTEAVKLTFY